LSDQGLKILKDAGKEPSKSRTVYLLPASTQLECAGSVTASNRSVQWREKVIDPLFESRNDHMIMYQLAQKLGFADQLIGKQADGTSKIKLVKGKGGMDEPDVEDLLREINRSCWTIGYTGQSPERLQAHMRNMHVFDVRTLRAKGGKDAKTGYVLDGDYFGLPWPCYGTPQLKHPGSPVLYNTSLNIMDGGGNFRANFGVERDGVNLLAEDGSCSAGADITTGYPEFDHVLLKKLGWWNELTDEEKKAAEGKNWKTDLSGGIQRIVMKNHVVIRGAMPKRAPWFGIFRTPCRCIASRFSVRDRISSTSIRPTMIRRCAGACRFCSRPSSRPTRMPRNNIRLFSRAGAWSSMKAEGRKRARTRGWPSFSRKCSSRSIPRMRTTATSRTTSTCGSRRRPARV